MKPSFSAQRIYASLMMLGPAILLYRTLRMMLVEDAFTILALWTILLLIAEFLIDLAWFAASLRWFILNRREKAVLALRLGAAAVILHAIRVLVYVLGRTGPWINFDVKPEQRAGYTFDWLWVYFAATLSILGLVGVIVIWQIIKNRRKKERLSEEE